MKKIFTLFLLLVFSFPAWASDLNDNVFKEDVAQWKDYLTIIRDYNSKEDDLSSPKEIRYSNFKTKKVLIKSSDLSKVPYDKSVAKFIIVTISGPTIVIEVKKYKTFHINWVNEELIHFQIWPGRCLELDQIININTKEIIYSGSFQHCGVN